MRVDICPTVLADDQDSFDHQMHRLASFVERVHIDLVDGDFAPAKTIDIENVWWPGGVQADLHVMFKRPFDYMEAIIGLHPQLIIVHAEAEGDFVGFAHKVHHHGMEAGVAMLPETTFEMIEPALGLIDHVLIFSGHLGNFGGHADLKLLDKVKQIKAAQPRLEIGWDGGVNDQNAAKLAAAGVQVLNAGGYLHGAKNPAEAYQKLKDLTNGKASSEPVIVG